MRPHQNDARQFTKGLPDDSSIRDLAQTWIDDQTRLWPEFVSAGLIPTTSEQHIDRLLQGFKDRFAGLPDPDVLGFPKEVERGCCYVRYSCDHSNPRSLDQQLHLILQRARDMNIFISWDMVFADAAVTGTTSKRQGYQLAKGILRKNDAITTLLVDEIDRASRDQIEIMELQRFVDQYDKRLIGVSDGSDSTSQAADLNFAFRGILAQGNVQQLKKKVNRGMLDTFRQGGLVSSPCFGYKVEFCKDELGQPILQRGKARRQMVIDVETAPWVVKMFELYGIEHQSLTQIARYFNEMKAGGRHRWSADKIQKLLLNKRFIGIEEYWKRTKSKRDGRLVFRRENEWQVRESPSLRIISDELWEKTQCRVKECSMAYGKRFSGSSSPDGLRRNDLYPTMLFHPECGYCGKPLWKGRAGKYAALCCTNGNSGKLGCQLIGYKNVSLIEKCLLERIREEFLDQAFWDEAFDSANTFLQEMAAKPKADFGPINASIDAKVKAKSRLLDRLETTSEEDIPELDRRIARIDDEIAKLRKERTSMDAANKPVPLESIDRESFDRLVADLQSLLNDDPAASSNALQALVGRVRITKADEMRGRDAVWLAEFSLQPAAAVAIVAKRSNHPTSSAWEYLCGRNWTIGRSVRTVITERPKAASIARQVFPLASQGQTLDQIFSTTRQGIPVLMALTAFYGLDATELAYPTVPHSSSVGKALYGEIGPVVMELRDRYLVPLRKIAREAGYPRETVNRAYRYQLALTLGHSKARPLNRARQMPADMIINRCKVIGRHYRLGTDPKFVASELGIPVRKVIRYRTAYAQVAREFDRWRRWG